MTLTNYVATKDLFQALIRAKRGVRSVGVPAASDAARPTSAPPELAARSTSS